LQTKEGLSLRYVIQKTKICGILRAVVGKTFDPLNVHHIPCNLIAHSMLTLGFKNLFLMLLLLGIWCVSLKKVIVFPLPRYIVFLNFFVAYLKYKNTTDSTKFERFYTIKLDELLWFFKLGCVESLLWDLREWSFLQNAPFFEYLDKRCNRCNLTSVSANLGQLALLNFIQRLGLGEDNPKLFNLVKNFKFVWCYWNIFAKERKTNTFNWASSLPYIFLSWLICEGLAFVPHSLLWVPSNKNWSLY
jgi:hypothetical protein